MDECLPREWVAPYLRPMIPEPTRALPRGALSPPIECLMCDLYGTLFISGSGDLGPPAAAADADPARVPTGPPQPFPPPQRPPAWLTVLLARYGRPDMSARHLTDRLHAAIAAAHAHARSRGVAFPEVRIERIWRQVLPELDDAAIRRFAVEYEMQVNPVWPMPHLEDLLQACRNRGIVLGIISNAQFFTPCLFEWFLDRPLEALGFDRTLVFFSYRHGVAKPSASLFQMALARLAHKRISPRRVAYLGNDMRKDITPAGELGMQTVLFAGDARSLRIDAQQPDATGTHPQPRRPDQAPVAMAPDLVVTSLTELIPFLTPLLPANPAKPG